MEKLNVQSTNKKEVLKSASHQEMWDWIDTKADTEVQWLDMQASYLRSLMVGDDDRLGRIGSGVQYVVYEIPNNKVFKVAQTNRSARNEFRRQGGDDAEVAKILEQREIGAAYVQDLVRDYPESSYIFGNPVFNGEKKVAGAFEQDKVTFLDVSNFNKLPNSEQINYIGKFLDLVKKTWTYGCSDKTMNFQVNTGMNSDNKLILSDFGEMDLSKNDVLRTIKNRRWEKAWGINVLNDDMKKIAIDMFNSELTEDRLDRLWARNKNR